MVRWGAETMKTLAELQDDYDRLGEWVKKLRAQQDEIDLEMTKVAMMTGKNDQRTTAT
jgi:hypothetical protein